MRYLGIDFGSKRVGVALSDETNRLSFPYSVFPNDEKLLERICEVIKEKDITEVVIGESTDFKGDPNVIMDEIGIFKRGLEEKTKLKTVFEPEFLTSAQAERIQGKGEMTDASAAAIILQSYMDKRANY